MKREGSEIRRGWSSGETERLLPLIFFFFSFFLGLLFFSFTPSGLCCVRFFLGRESEERAIWVAVLGGCDI